MAISSMLPFSHTSILTRSSRSLHFPDFVLRLFLMSFCEDEEEILRLNIAVSAEGSRGDHA